MVSNVHLIPNKGAALSAARKYLFRHCEHVVGVDVGGGGQCRIFDNNHSSVVVVPPGWQYLEVHSRQQENIFSFIVTAAPGDTANQCEDGDYDLRAGTKGARKDPSSLASTARKLKK